MKTYSAASQDLIDHIRYMRDQYHPGLKDVAVGALFVHDDEHGDAVLKHNGYPAAAVVSIMPLKHRALGAPDALIIMDRAFWLGSSSVERNAVCDHELQHLDRVLDEATDDKPAGPKFDSIGRPVLRMRRHDRQFGWFDEVAKRHGTASIEVRQAAAMIADAETCQLYFDFASVVHPLAPPPSPATPPPAPPSGGGAPPREERVDTEGADAAIAKDQAEVEREPDDPLYAGGVEVVRKESNASISHLQNRLRIGYNRAARMLERMEAEGIVSPAEGRTGFRKVLPAPDGVPPVESGNTNQTPTNPAAEGRKGTLRLVNLERDAAAVAARHPRREDSGQRRR